MSSDKYGFRNFSFCDSHSEVVDRLTKTAGDLRLFDNMYELFTLAATVGFMKKSKVASIKTGKTIEFNQFRSFDNFDGIFLCICLGHEGDSKILNNTEDNIALRLKIFSEYANGGMAILKEEVINAPGELAENFVHFIKKYGDNFSTKEKSDKKLNKFTHLLEGLE